MALRRGRHDEIEPLLAEVDGPLATDADLRGVDGQIVHAAASNCLRISFSMNFRPRLCRVPLMNPAT